MDANIILVISIIAVIGLYIVARLFSSRTECVILYKWYDFAALVWIGFLPLFYLLISILSEEKSLSGFLLSPVGIIAIAIPLLELFISSIIANLGNGDKTVLYIIISLLGKIPFIVLSFIIAFGLYSVLNAGSSATKDGRYRDGTKGNQKSKSKRRALAVFLFIFTPLVISVVKPSVFQDSIKERIRHKTED